MNAVTEYLSRIRSGEIVTSKRVRRMYEKLQQDIECPGEYLFDNRRAEKPIKFIEQFCRHSKGEWAGRPVYLELFQKAFISALFGFVHRDTGLRKYKEAMLFVARKNGKSTLLSCLALYALIADGEPGAEVYSCATKRDQAKIIFDEVICMMRQSPDLSRVLRKRKSDLWCDTSFSKMQPLGKNSDSLDGLNASLCIIDELHAIQDKNLYEVLKQSQSARRQPLLVMITTAGHIRESVFDDLYKYSAGIVDGTIKDEHFLPVLYELDDKEEWQNPKCWIKANPSLGRIKKESDIREKCQRARQNPADLAGLLCKDFNLPQTTSQAWLSFEDFNNTETFDIAALRGSYFIGGVDLSRTTDLTAACALMTDKQGKRYVKMMFWLPEDNFLQRVHDEKIPYDLWHSAGLLRLCRGNTINYSDVTQWYVDLVKIYGLTPAWVYFDSYAARYWTEEMSENGFNMVKCLQGYKTLSIPMQRLGADLKSKLINYDNNPLLKWNLGNTGIQVDVNANIRPIKAQSAKHRIDGVCALLDAYCGLIDHYKEFQQLAVYEGKQ